MKRGGIDDNEIDTDTINADASVQTFMFGGTYHIIVPPGRAAFQVTSQVTAFTIPRGSI